MKQIPTFTAMKCMPPAPYLCSISAISPSMRVTSIWACYLPITGFGLRCRADAVPSNAHNEHNNNNNNNKRKKNVVVVGTGWAGLGAAHHLSKQGFDVAVLEGDGVSGLKNLSGDSVDVGIHGFWRPYQNIFSLVDELGVKPFSYWRTSALCSSEGLEVEFPIFQDLPQLPAPLGVLFYTQHRGLPLLDRLTSLPLAAAAIDFDNTDTAWRKYDPLTARELFKQFGCSEKLYRQAFSPILQVSLFSPAEQCSAAAMLGMLNYFILSHQSNFDAVWCRGTVREKIFKPWVERIKVNNCQFLEGKKVTDFLVNEETGCISEVVCGKESFVADAVVLAVGISRLQQMIRGSSALKKREEFLKVLKLAGIDVLTATLWLDRKVRIPNAINACFGFDDLSGWTFFDLNTIYDEFKDDSGTVVEANFYRANHLLPLEDEQIVQKVMSCLSKCQNAFKDVNVAKMKIGRYPESLTHYFPGSYEHMMRGATTFPNLFVAGDWIVNRHGSWAQEKAFVTGLEAANRVVDYLEEGSFAKIIPLEEDEPHVQSFHSFNRSFNEIRAQLPLSEFFL